MTTTDMLVNIFASHAILQFMDGNLSYIKLNDVEVRYTSIEKLFLSLFYNFTKLTYYLLPKDVLFSCKICIVKYSINRPILKTNEMGH